MFQLYVFSFKNTLPFRTGQLMDVSLLDQDLFRFILYFVARFVVAKSVIESGGLIRINNKIVIKFIRVRAATKARAKSTIIESAKTGRVVLERRSRGTLNKGSHGAGYKISLAPPTFIDDSVEFNMLPFLRIEAKRNKLVTVGSKQ